MRRYSYGTFAYIGTHYSVVVVWSWVRNPVGAEVGATPTVLLNTGIPTDGGVPMCASCTDSVKKEN